MTVSKRASHTEWVDPDDAPELTDEFFEQADEYIGDKLVRRGRGRGRPIGSHKAATTIRLDDEVLEAFKATGRGWQTRMNAALKDWLRTHKLA
ncbi:MAG TPA: BrnA antitoxin family protein [Trinickia sp.]|uniref:BrnA antitoxin family protein n=1 Tax=Trinickia sp. TaxID=2571163 RepID=UPI002D07C7DD|nr:BrnA antitoxin family protein [Trinickia sp.]HVW53284.1 BrnA antitoxin family protein [Trinickia sp.]